MKKMIGLIVVVVVIWGTLRMLGINFFVSWRTPSARLSDAWKSSKDKTIEDIIGAPLPKSATNIHRGSTNYPQRYRIKTAIWITAKLPKEDFYELVTLLELEKRADLLDFWPDAFECSQNAFYERLDTFWHLTGVVTEDTYYGEKAEEDTCMVFKYENGQLYIKKLTTYLSIVGQENTWHDVIKGRPAVEYYITHGPFPESATDICVDGVHNLNGNKVEQTCWVVAKLPKEDFYDLVDQLKLTKRPDLLEVWPDAFECAKGPFTEELNQFWDIRKMINEDTYYGEVPEGGTQTVCKYEGGKVYIKKTTKHSKAKRSTR